MKTLTMTIVLSLTTFFLNAQSDSRDVIGTTIKITVPIQSTEGKIYAALYNEGDFMQNPSTSLEGEIIDGIASITFNEIVPGEYAIVLFHDKNGNKRMDFEPNGMPMEMYGISNNPMSMGPPTWRDAKFVVSSIPIELEIRL